MRSEATARRQRYDWRNWRGEAAPAARVGGASEGLRAQTSIAALRSAPSPSATSYAARVVTVQLTDGATLRMFLKDFGSSRLFKEGASDRRARELHVYRDLLRDAELGIPAYYGAVWGRGARTLLDGRRVRRRSSGCRLRVRLVAGGDRVARTHAGAVRARSGPLRALTVADPARCRLLCIQSRARALQRAASIRPGDATPATILSGYDDFVALMADQPSTFVHGSYRPENVLIDEPSTTVAHLRRGLGARRDWFTAL